MSADGGFNVLILAFFLSSPRGPTDLAEGWQGVDNATKASTIAALHSMGAVALVTVGGANDLPLNVDPTQLATEAATWAVANQLDGVDFDVENLAPGFTFGAMSDTAVVNWLVTASAAARAVMPTGIITHAPQSPYIGAVGGAPGNVWAGPTGGYTSVWRLANGNGTGTPVIDWLNTQFYSQGPSCYTDFASLFLQSNVAGACSNYPNTSVAELAAYGIGLAAIVVGKPLESSDAPNGYVTPADLGAYVAMAGKEIGWAAGVMAWSWDEADGAAWIAAVYPPGTGGVALKGAV